MFKKCQICYNITEQDSDVYFIDNKLIHIEDLSELNLIGLRKVNVSILSYETHNKFEIGEHISYFGVIDKCINFNNNNVILEINGNVNINSCKKLLGTTIHNVDYKINKKWLDEIIKCFNNDNLIQSLRIGCDVFGNYLFNENKEVIIHDNIPEHILEKMSPVIKKFLLYKNINDDSVSTIKKWIEENV